MQVPYSSSSNNPDMSYTEKTDIPVPCAYSISWINGYGKNKIIYHRGKDCIEKF